MEMNNLRVESHIAQKNRRHKLRFQQNSGDLNHPQHHFEVPHRPISYNPSEMVNNSIPYLLLPPGHDHQDSCNSGEGIFATSNNNGGNNLPNPLQDSNNWKTTTPDHHHWNVVGYNSNAASMNSGCYFNGYHQDVPAPLISSSSPFYLQDNNIHVTLAQPYQTITRSWMNSSEESGLLMANRVHDHRAQQTTMAANEGSSSCNTQGCLSLSLSSVPQPKDELPTLQSGQKPVPDSDPKSFMGVFAHRNTGPLGPFTGYATILKNSKYLKSAQELLNDSCDLGCQEFVQTCDDAYSHKILEEEMSRASGGSDEHVTGRRSSNTESLRPEFHRKKARLLHMQEEVCRRYKQYLQQMQMVISSFETVAGLSAATPYVCLALKAVSRHFHHVKNVISEQLSQMRKMVGEGLCSSTTTTTSSKAFDGNPTPTDQNLGKSGSSGSAARFFASQPPVWRPQRGLPERAISVLKTWLFDHFLHPYPSDADKHMLASQTGLTRNQVSNWFINARVRIWKPMVEEIHTLETKGLVEPNSTNPQLDGQDPNRMDMNPLSNTQPPPECSRNPGNLTVHEPNDQLEKLSRPEYQIPLANMDRLMSIMPYPRATFDASGLGPVSLTLGLRQNGEHVQQLQQRFGGQLIPDFVG